MEADSNTIGINLWFAPQSSEHWPKNNPGRKENTIIWLIHPGVESIFIGIYWNIIKLQSLVHNQLSSPRYYNLFKYSWFKSGYVTERPNRFENPVDFAFQRFSRLLCDVEGCSEIAVVTCLWCKKLLCFKNFFDEYHYCTEYIK